MVLLDRPGAYGLRRYFASGAAVRSEDLARLLRTVPRRGAIDRAGLVTATGWSPARVQRHLNALRAVGAVVEDRPGIRRSLHHRTETALAEQAARLDARYRVDAATGVELVRRYAETDDCRRRLILQSLGEDHPNPCGNCDNCAAGTSRPATGQPWRIGARVRHSTWGIGTVHQYEADRVVVHFVDAGFRTLDIAVAAQHGLLRPQT